MAKAFPPGAKTGVQPIDLFNTPCVIPGVQVQNVEVHSNKIDVTTFGDNEPVYIQGTKTIKVEIVCHNAEGFKALAAMLTGEKEEKIKVPVERPIVGESDRKVLLDG